MTKINKQILLNNDFVPVNYYDKCVIYMYYVTDFLISIEDILNKCWNVNIDKDLETITSEDIETVEQFNMLMKLMNINFKLKL